MYIIESDGFVVHDGFMNDRDYTVLSGTMTTEFNRAGTLTFTVPSNNAAYKGGYLRKLISIIRVYDKKKRLKWKGRILDSSKDFYGNVTYNCEGWLGVLNDSLIRPNGTGGGGSSGTGASVVERAISWMEALANDESHGYDQVNRWGPDYDCSSSVITAWEQAGVPVKSAGATYTGDMRPIFLNYGFQDVTGQVNIADGTGLIRGDVLLHEQNHVAMYCGNGYEVEALVNERGQITGGTPGDQTGNEIVIREYRSSGSFGTWQYVLRYPQGGGGGEDTGRTSPVGTVVTYNLTDEQIQGLANVFYTEQGNNDAGVRACASHLCNRFEKWPRSGLNDPYNYLIYSGWWGSSQLNIGRINGSHGVAGEALVQATSEVIREGKRTLPLFVDEYDQLADVRRATNNGAEINKNDRHAYVKDLTIVENIYAEGANDRWTFWGFPDGPDGVCDAFGYINKPEGAIDFIPAEAGTVDGGSGETGEDTITIAPSDYFVWLIQNHNEQVDGVKRLNVMMPANIFTTPVTFPAANYESTLEYIQTNFIANESIGGRIWVEENDIYFYPDGTEGTSLQPIEFGNNLLDLTENYDASELFTVIIPTGKDGLKLTPTYDLDYIRNETGVAAYGIIVRHAEFPEIEDPALLYTLAEELLKNNIEQTFNLEVSAFDLGLVNDDVGEVKVGTFVEVYSAPHNLEKAYICTASEVDLTNPANTKFSLGVNLDTLTTKQLSLVRNISRNTGYTSDLPSYDMTYQVYKARVNVIDISFKRSGHSIQLLFRVKVLKVFNDDADGGPIILTFDRAYAPNLDIRFSTVYNSRTKKTYTLECTRSGFIEVFNGGDIAIDDELSGNANWTYT